MNKALLEEFIQIPPMSLYTIQPIADLLDKISGQEITREELAHARHQVQKTLARKEKIPAQAHSTVIEQKYLQYFNKIEKKFSRAGKLSRTRLIHLIDQLLRREHFAYYEKIHEPAHRNFFISGFPTIEECYDIAFYNKKAPRNPKAHHKHWWRSCVHYARLERNPAGIVIGNIQIDAPTKITWRNPHHQQILLMRKNLYRSLVQEALTHAMACRPPRIFFHSGETMERAQHCLIASTFRMQKITEDNFADYQARYEELQPDLANIEVGTQSPYYDKKHGGYGLVIEKTANAYKALYRGPDNRGQGLSNHMFTEFWNMGGADVKPDKAWKVYCEIFDLKFKLRKTKDYADFLALIESYFRALDSSYRPTHSGEKLSTLKELLVPIVPPRNEGSSTDAEDSSSVIKDKEAYEAARTKYLEELDNALDKFLIKYNYQKPFCVGFPQYKVVSLAPATAARLNRSAVLLYHPERDAAQIKTFPPPDALRPKIGKSYVIKKGEEELPLMKIKHRRLNNFMFYEKTLPEVFDRLGLKYRKTTITTDWIGHAIRSEVWEIIGDWGHWAKKPLVSF